MRILIDSNILISAVYNPRGTPYRAFLKVVAYPNKEIDDEQAVRDSADRPILRAAVNAHADILLTGDKDFPEANITNLKVMTASDFLNSNI